MQKHGDNEINSGQKQRLEVWEEGKKRSDKITIKKSKKQSFELSVDTIQKVPSAYIKISVFVITSYLDSVH